VAAEGDSVFDHLGASPLADLYAGHAELFFMSTITVTLGENRAWQDKTGTVVRITTQLDACVSCRKQFLNPMCNGGPLLAACG